MVHRNYVSKRIHELTGYSYFNTRVLKTRTVFLYDYARHIWSDQQWRDLTEKEFDKVLLNLRAQFPEKDLAFLDAMTPRLQAVMPPSITLKSFRYYPSFRVLTYMGDGFPMARFVFDTNFNNVYCAFLGDWRENRLLMMRDPDSHNASLTLAANPGAIPHIFPVTALVEQFAKIRV